MGIGRRGTSRSNSWSEADLQLECQEPYDHSYSTPRLSTRVASEDYVERLDRPILPVRRRTYFEGEMGDV
jgi:hypothetical protein